MGQEPLQAVTVGRIVRVNVALPESHDSWHKDRWRPAIVVEVWGDSANPSAINAVAFLDGLNDRAYGAAPIAHHALSGDPPLMVPVICTLWITSAVHGFGPGEWCWPDELERYMAETLVKRVEAAEGEST